MTQQMNDVEKTAVDVLGHQYRDVLSLWPFTLFVIPIFNRSDYVCFISFAEHYLNLVHRVVFWIFKKDVQTAARRLLSFLRNGFKFAKPKTRWIFNDLVLQPILV